MLNCNIVQYLLAEYRTGILDARRTKEVEQHITHCSECAAELKILDETLSLIEANVPDYEPPVGLWNGVYNRITEPQAKQSRWDRAVCRWIRKPVVAAGTGLATLALAAALITGGPWQTNTSHVEIASNEYSQGHALYASQAPFANQANYISLAAQSESNASKE